jgi:hypothetical protein
MRRHLLSAASASALAFCLAVVFVSTPARADDKAAAAPKAEKKDPAAAAPAAPAAPAAAKGKEVTLKGTMTCAKCGLKEGDKCQNVLKVGKAGKEEKYYLAANEVAEKNHEHVCSGESKATVKGTVAEEAGKKLLTASSIQYAK